jgi:hypothetical protein
MVHPTGQYHLRTVIDEFNPQLLKAVDVPDCFANLEHRSVHVSPFAG